ncbi:hypothetical protein ACFWUZ_01910 [Streptomyces sp. NPDC058646]
MSGLRLATPCGKEFRTVQIEEGLAVDARAAAGEPWSDAGMRWPPSLV